MVSLGFVTHTSPRKEAFFDQFFFFWKVGPENQEQERERELEEKKGLCTKNHDREVNLFNRTSKGEARAKQKKQNKKQQQT